MKRRRALTVILLILILATLCFIFSNSLKSMEESGEQSNAIGELISQVIPKDTKVGSFIQTYLRKIAHFTEFGLLGIECTLLCFVLGGGPRRFALSVGFGFMCGFFDETVQIFSKRGSSVSDVWIDGGGFAFYSLITALAVLIISLIVKLCRKNKEVHHET